jgi:hypothetical protein
MNWKLLFFLLILIVNCWPIPETLAETSESGPLILCITDLFQNKSVAYFLTYNCFLIIFYIVLSYIFCNFSVRMLKYFFAHKKLKKPPQKVAYLWQLGVFLICSPDCPKQPRTSFPFYKLFYTTIFARISDPYTYSTLSITWVDQTSHCVS